MNDKIITKKEIEMKAKLFMATAAAALILAGCSNDENEPADNWNGEIRLSSGVAAQQVTRSIATDLQGAQIADGIHVGFFINEHPESATTTYTQNLDYTANGMGAFSGTAVYYPQSGNGVDIYAYAPWESGLLLTGTYAFTVATDQSTDDNYLASDLLWGQPMKNGTESANPVARTKDNVPVSFKHLLSKIQVTLKPGSGLTADDFKGATLKVLQVLPGTTLTLSDGTISAASGDRTDLTAATYDTQAAPASSVTAAAIVVPQTITERTKFFEVDLTTGGKLFYTLPDGGGGLSLAGGKIYKYEITVNLTGLTVTSTIEDWATIGGDPVQGSAVMD